MRSTLTTIVPRFSPEIEALPPKLIFLLGRFIAKHATTLLTLHPGFFQGFARRRRIPRKFFQAVLPRLLHFPGFTARGSPAIPHNYAGPFANVRAARDPAGKKLINLLECLNVGKRATNIPVCNETIPSLPPRYVSNHRHVFFTSLLNSLPVRAARVRFQSTNPLPAVKKLPQSLCLPHGR